MIKEELRRVDEAFADIMSLVDSGSKIPPVLRALGNIIQQHPEFSGHIDLVISLLKTALEEKAISPHEINSYYFLIGHLYQKKKDYDSAFASQLAGGAEWLPLGAPSSNYRMSWFSSVERLRQ